MADTSFGYSESSRVWGFYPGYAAKKNIGNSGFHIFQTAGLAYNSEGQQTDSWGSSGSTYSYSYSNVRTFTHPIVVVAGIGTGVDLTGAVIDLSLNFGNGLGKGHEHSVTTNINDGVTTTRDERTDSDPADLSYLKLAGKFDLTSDTKLTSYIIKSLKGVADHGAAGLGVDDMQEFATLGAGIGISQKF